MKKLILHLLMASVVISAVSCQKEAALEPENTEKTPSGFVRWSFTADMPETKTTLDLGVGSVTWEAGDVITLYYLDGDNAPKSVEATTETGGANATFTADIPEGDAPDHFWAAYPASSGALTYDGGEKFTITCGRVDGTFKSANIMAAYSTAAAKSFAFKHAVGIIALALPSGGIISHNETDYPITTIRVKGKETSIHSMGTVEVTSDGTSVTSFADAGGTSSAAVDINDAVRASGTAYLPSFPGTLTNGLAIRYYSNTGNVPAILTKNAAITVSRGHILPISDLTSHIVWDYYVSASGSGDGLTPATAMSVNDFLAFLEEGKNGGTNVIMCYANRINGVTFHFTAGSHSISSPITLPAQTIYSEATYYTIDGDNAATLDGGGASRIFEFTNAGDRITIKNLTFTNGSTESGGIALIQNAAPHFENCTFTNTTSTGAGGAVRVETASKGAGTFNGCTFSNCTGQNGGAIVITNPNTSLTLTDCVFSDNQATASGGALYSTNGITTLRNCSFTANKAANLAGAAYITTGTVHFDTGCTLRSNSAVNGGGAVSIDGAGTAYFNGCVLDKNTSKLGGAFYTVDNKAAKYYVNACVFTDNTVSGGNGYAIYLNTSNAANFATLCINNSTLYNTANMTGTNASLVCNKGKTIITNSTLYGTTSQWGTYALGCHKNYADHYGCLLLNCIFINTTAGKPAIYQTGANYYAIAKNCIASNVSSNTQFTQTNIVTTIPALTYDNGVFTWDGNSSLPHLTKENIVAELSNENYKIAPAFLTWLNEINAMDTDLAGNERTGYIWAGSYQN